MQRKVPPHALEFSPRLHQILKTVTGWNAQRHRLSHALRLGLKPVPLSAERSHFHVGNSASRPENI